MTDLMNRQNTASTKGLWWFYCGLVYEYGIEEVEANPHGALAKYYSELKEKYGEMENWPRIGCGCRYTPESKGPGMVIESGARTASGKRSHVSIRQRRLMS